MTVLVTGGAGMVGRHLKDISPDYIYLSRKDCDLTKYDEVEKVFKFYKPTNIIHLAAKVGGILQNIKFPADFYDANIMMNSNVLIAAKKLKEINPQTKIKTYKKALTMILNRSST